MAVPALSCSFDWSRKFAVSWLACRRSRAKAPCGSGRQVHDIFPVPAAHALAGTKAWAAARSERHAARHAARPAPWRRSSTGSRPRTDTGAKGTSEPRTAPNVGEQVDEPVVCRPCAEPQTTRPTWWHRLTNLTLRTAWRLKGLRGLASRGNAVNEAVERGPSAPRGAATSPWKTSRRTRILRKPTSYERIRVNGRRRRTASSAR